MTSKTLYKYYSEVLGRLVYVYAYSEKQARNLAKQRVMKKTGIIGTITLSIDKKKEISKWN